MTAVRRVVLMVGLASVAAFSHGQSVTLQGTYQGQNVGTGTFTIERQAGGEVLKSLVVHIALQGHKYTSESSRLIAKSGALKQLVQKAVVDGKTTVSYVVTFDKKNAKVFDKANGTTRSVPIPPGGAPGGPTEFWFMGVKPKKGQPAPVTDFVPSTGFTAESITYTGDRQVSAGGKKVMGHVISLKQGAQTYERVMNDHGLPLRLEVPNVPGLVFTLK